MLTSSRFILLLSAMTTLLFRAAVPQEVTETWVQSDANGYPYGSMIAMDSEQNVIVTGWRWFLEAHLLSLDTSYPEAHVQSKQLERESEVAIVGYGVGCAAEEKGLEKSRWPGQQEMGENEFLFQVRSMFLRRLSPRVGVGNPTPPPF